MHIIYIHITHIYEYKIQNIIIHFSVINTNITVCFVCAGTGIQRLQNRKRYFWRIEGSCKQILWSTNSSSIDELPNW